MNKITPRKSIDLLHREIDIGDRGEYKYLLDKNERIDPHAKKIISEIKIKVTSDLISRYPNQKHAYSVLSSFLDISENNLVLFPGSDSALKAIYESFIDPGDIVIIPSPSYAMAAVYADLYQANVYAIDYLENKDVDLNKIINQLDSNPATRLLYIPNPGQPYGNHLTSKDLLKLIKKAATYNTLIIVDEAFYGFKNDTVIDLVSQFSNLIIMRTFSKLFGLAGVRIGYLVLPNYIKNIVQKVKPLHDINSFSMAAMEVIIDNYDLVKNHVKMLHDSKKYLQKRMREIGLKCYYNYTNFIYIEFKSGFDVESLDVNLRKKGILARVNYGGTANNPSLRITLSRLTLMKYVGNIISEHLTLHES